MDDSLHSGQADAGSLELGVVVKSLKRAEEFVGVGHVEPGAVIAYEEDRISSRVLLSDIDSRIVFLGGEFPGVAHQVFENDREEVRVGNRAQPVFDATLDRSFRLPSCQLGGDIARDRGDVDSLALLRVTRARCSMSSMRPDIFCVPARTRCRK
jgi:hypothetical protein